MPKPTFFNLPDDKRARVVDAAIDEFAERTYGSASISRICDAADIAKGSFYQYFTGKLDLYRWLVFAEMGSRKIAFMKALGPAPSQGFFASFEHLSLAGLRWGMANPKLVRAAEWALHPTLHPDMQKLSAEIGAGGVQGMRAMLVDAQRSGEVRADVDLDLAAELVLVTMRQGLDAALRSRVGCDMIELCGDPERAGGVDDADLIAVVHGLMDFLARGLGTGAVDGPGIDLDAVQLLDTDVDDER